MTNQTSQGQTIRSSLEPLARLVWYLVSLSVLIFYIYGISLYHKANYPAPALISETLNRIGLAGELYAIVTIAADLLFVGAFILMGYFMFWRRGDNHIVFVASLTMISMTHIFTGLTLYVSGEVYAQYNIGFSTFLGFIGNGLMLLSVYT